MDGSRLGPDERLDDYGSAVLLWPWRRSLADFRMDTRAHSLVCTLGLVHFETVAPDDTRTLYLRAFRGESTVGQRTWARSSGRADCVPRATTTPYTGSFQVGDVTPELAIEILEDGDVVRLRDLGGQIDVSYRRLAGGARWLCAGPQEDIAFTTEQFEVRGEVFGQPAHGLGGWEMCFGVPGTLYGTSKVMRLLERSYFHFANVYDDGAFEYGHVCDGFGEFSWAYLVDQDGFHAERHNDTWRPSFDDDGRLVSAEHWFGGERWQWITTGVVADFLPAEHPIRAYLGTFSRIGERRSPRLAWGWIEVRDPAVGIT